MADEELNLFKESQLFAWDFVVIVVYFLSVLTVGIWVSFLSVVSTRFCRVILFA